MTHVYQPLAGGGAYFTSGLINGSMAVGGTWSAYSTLTLPAYTLGGTVTSNGQSFSGTIANLGTVTTVDINGGTIDGVALGGASAVSLGTPSSGTLTNCSGLPVSTGIAGLGTGVATFLATPSSANLASAVTGETGSGALVFATSPSFTTPTINTAASVGGTWTAAATWTLPAFTLGGTVTSNGQSFSGTIANLGTVTTADINGGTIDGAVIGGASAAAGTFTTLTANTSATAPYFVSSVAVGTAPFQPTSTTVCANLNADLLDGQHGSYYRDASNLNAGTVPTARIGSGTANSAAFLRGDSTWSNALTGSLDLSASGAGQIVFPATQNASSNANTLDDYQEETSWSPTITAQLGTFTTVSSTGWHTKVGNMVTFFLGIVITDAGTAAGGVTFPLPYTAAASWSGAGVMATTPYVSLYCVDAGSNYAIVLKYDATTAIATGAVLWVNGTFRV